MFGKENPLIRPHGPGETVPTVRIVSNAPGHAASGGFVEINADTYDPTRHKLFAGEVDPRAKKPKTVKQLAAGAASAIELLSSENEPFNKPIIVVDGKPVETASIVASAHAKSTLSPEAWNALTNDERHALLANELAARKAWG